MDGLFNKTGPSTFAERRKVGYASVAEWIALDPDNEPFIFRKFDELSARNLLYLQAEILAIEEQLERIDDADAASRDLGRLNLARTWETLNDSKKLGDQEARDRMTLILKLREKLKEYHEALLLQSEVAKLKKPGNRTILAFTQWLEHSYRPLGGRAQTFLSKRDDLVALKAPHQADYLSILMRRYWPAKSTQSSQDRLDGTGRFEERHVAIAVAVVDVIVAAILLVGSITSLYFVKSDFAKLGLITMFTASFALSVGLTTNARRAEVFGATAAYAAVLVVFVSGDLSNSGSGS